MSLLVVSCLKSQLASDFAKTLDVPLIQLGGGFFADTEVYVDAKNTDLIAGSEVLFVHQFFLNTTFEPGASPKGDGSTSSPRARLLNGVRPEPVEGCEFNKPLNSSSLNDQLVSFLVACDLLKNIGAKKITVILPYLAYSRQDESFDGKFVGSIKLWGRFFKEAGINRVFACDLHSEKLLNLFDVDLEEISLVNFWADHIKSNFSDEINKNLVCIVSPDRGGFNRASAVAKILNVPVACVDKKRVSPDNPVALCLHGDVNSKVAIIVDDIIDTGKTSIQASLMLKMHGSTKIIGVFTHAIFSQGAMDRLMKSEFCKIYVSNSLPDLSAQSHDKISICSINKYLIQKISEKLS